MAIKTAPSSVDSNSVVIGTVFAQLMVCNYRLYDVTVLLLVCTIIGIAQVIHTIVGAQ